MVLSMRLLYCYVHFLNENGKAVPYRGLKKIEFNFSAADRFSYNYETNTLIRRGRRSPLPDNFWSDKLSQDAETNIYNINVISGGNGSGKTTSIHYLIELLDSLHAAVDPSVTDSGRKERNGVSGNRVLLLLEEMGKQYLIDYTPFKEAQSGDLQAEGFPDDGLHIIHCKSWCDFSENPKEAAEAISALLKTKLIYLTNTLSQQDYERSRGEENRRLRDYFVYDVSLGSIIGQDIARYFPYEVYKQVCYIFDRTQVEKRLSCRERIPELVMPHTLCLHLRQELFENALFSNVFSQQTLSSLKLPNLLAALCAAAFAENLNRLAAFDPKYRSDYVPSSEGWLSKGSQALILDIEKQFEQSYLIKSVNEHTHRVNCITALSNGFAISGSWDNTLRVWNPHTGECLYPPLTGHTSGIRCVAVTEDGLAVSGSDDCTLRVWDLRTGKCLYPPLTGHTERITCVAVTKDGLAVSGSDDCTLRVWDLCTGKCLHELNGHRKQVRCVAVADDGIAVSGSDDCTLRVWDLRTGERLHVLNEHTGAVTCVATNGWTCISGSNDNTLRIWDLRTGECSYPPLAGHTRHVRCVAVTKGGLVVSGSDDCALLVWDLRTGKPLHPPLTGHTKRVRCVAVTEDGLAVSGSDDKTMRIWNINTGKPYKHLGCSAVHSAGITCVAIFPDHTIVGGSADGKIVIDRTLAPPDEILNKARNLRKNCLAYIRFLVKKSNSLFSRFQQVSDDETAFELSLDSLVSLLPGSSERMDRKSDETEFDAQQEGKIVTALYNDLITFMQKYIKICKPTYTIDFDWGLSSGEENMLRLFSNLYHIFGIYDNGVSDRDNRIYNNESHSDDKSKKTICDSVLLFMDEADLTLHPEWQRRLILILTVILPQIFPPACAKDIQVILSTHSPLLLGDIPSENITYLPQKKEADRPSRPPEETFGQNIHTILKESFFLENGTVGAFAAKRINHIAARLKEIKLQAAEEGRTPVLEEDLKKLKQEIRIVAPGVLRARLEQLYRATEAELRSWEGTNTMNNEERVVSAWQNLSPEQRQRLLKVFNRERDNDD